MTDAQKLSDALLLADDRPTHGGDDLYQWAIDAEDVIRRMHARVKELESELEAVGAGGVQPLRKGMVPLREVLDRLAQGFGRESAPVTTIRGHFERNGAGSAQPTLAEDTQDAERYRWLRKQHDKGDDSVTVFIGDEQHVPGHLDAQIDAAMAAQAEHDHG